MLHIREDEDEDEDEKTPFWPKLLQNYKLLEESQKSVAKIIVEYQRH